MALSPPGLPLTVLGAVNVLLRAVHLSEVLAVTDTLDSKNANADLDRANTAIQARGWYCNSEYDVTFVRTVVPPATSGTVTVDPKYLVVRPAYNTASFNKYLTVRSGKLYNLTDHTDLFTEDQHLDVIQALNFTDLPPALRWYIVCHAGRWFIPETYPAPASYRFSEAVELAAKAAAEHEDEDTRYGTLAETSPHFYRMRQR